MRNYSPRRTRERLENQSCILTKPDQQHPNTRQSHAPPPPPTRCSTHPRQQPTASTYSPSQPTPSRPRPDKWLPRSGRHNTVAIKTQNNQSACQSRLDKLGFQLEASFCEAAVVYALQSPRKRAPSQRGKFIVVAAFARTTNPMMAPNWKMRVGNGVDVEKASRKPAVRIRAGSNKGRRAWSVGEELGSDHLW